MFNFSLGLGINRPSAGTGFSGASVPRFEDLRFYGGDFDQNSVEIQDESKYGNNAALYSGRAIARSAPTDAIELNFTIPPEHQFQNLNFILTYYDAVYAKRWDTLTIPQNSATDNLRFVVDFSDAISEARLVDNWSGNQEELGRYVLNHYTDTTAEGLNGKPVFGYRKDSEGNVVETLVGSCTGCSAMVQEGIDPALIGLGAYGDKLWFDDIARNVSISPTSIPDGATLTTKFYPTASFCWLYDLQEINAAIYVNTGSYSFRIRSGGINYSFGDGSEIVIDGFNVAEISRSGNTYSVTLNGISLGSQVIPTEFYITHISAGAGTFPFKGLIESISGTISWDGTEADAIANGWTVNGSPSTVAQIRRTPPQVLGMNFNIGAELDYRDFDFTNDAQRFNGVRASRTSGQSIGGETDALRVTVDSSLSTNHYVVNTDAVKPGVDNRIRLQVYVPSTNVVMDGVRIGLNSGGQGFFNIKNPTRDTWIDVDFSPTIPSSWTANMYFIGYAGNSTVFDGNGTDWFAVRAIDIDEVDPDILIPEATNGIDVLGNPINPKAVLPYSDAQWFNGVDSRVTPISTISFGPNETLQFSTIIKSTDAGAVIIAGTAPTDRIFWNGATAFNSQIGGVNIPWTVPADFDFEVPHTFRYVRGATSIDLYIDDVLVASDPSFGTSVGQFTVIGNPDFVTGIAPLRGLLFNLSKTSGPNYLGYGPTPWSDTIGSNDGTPSGDLKTYQEAYDAGEAPAIEGTTYVPQLRASDELNADGSGYAQSPSSDSLKITTEATWVFRGNYNGPVPSVSKTILAEWGLSAGDRSFLFVRNSGNPQANEIRISLSSNGTNVHRRDYQTIDEDSLWVVRYNGPAGIFNVQRNGEVLSPQDTSGGFPSSLNPSSSPLTFCANGDIQSVINMTDDATSSVKIYNRYLTDEEVQKFGYAPSTFGSSWSDSGTWGFGHWGV